MPNSIHMQMHCYRRIRNRQNTRYADQSAQRCQSMGGPFLFLRREFSGSSRPYAELDRERATGM